MNGGLGMLPEGAEFDLFRGVAFFEGAEHLPPDMPLSLDEIRAWASRSGLVADASHVLTPQRIAAVAGVCSPDDRLLVGVALSGEPGSLGYREYAYLPVPSLIRRHETVSLVHWRMTNTGVKLRFLLAPPSGEFCSESTAAKVVPKFAAVLKSLAGSYPTKVYPDGSTAITVQGNVRATFRRDGRSFDVDLSHVPAAEQSGRS